MEISICICTRKRPQGLKRLLESILSMEPVECDCAVKLNIVENDDQPTLASYIEEIKTKSPYPVNYFVEPEVGISSARNKAVKESAGSDYCLFLDDDVVVDKDCLNELYRVVKEYNADGAWGQTLPSFENDVEPFIEKFHTQPVKNYGEIVESPATNALLIKKEWLDKIEGPFDARLNFTGGEDIFLTSQLTKRGAVIRYNPHAITKEMVPQNRTKLTYIIKRAFRNSNTYILVESLRGNLRNKGKLALRQLARLIYGALLLAPTALRGDACKHRGLIVMADACGYLAFTFGKVNTFYKRQL